MEGLEQWKKQAEQWSSQALQQWKNQGEPLWSQAHLYIQQVPPTQIYAALAILLLTSVLLLLGMYHCNFVILFFKYIQV